MGHRVFKALNDWNLLKGFLAIVLFFLASFAVLCNVYPIRERMSFRRYSLSQVLPEYVVMSLVVTCAVVLVVPLLTWWCNRFVIWMSVMIRTVVAFFILFLLVTYVGTSDDLEYLWPITQIQSFFSELRVIIFAYAYTPLVSTLAAVYYWWIARRTAIPRSSPKRYATRGRAREP